MSFGFPELVLVLIIALILFGPSKLPEMGRSLGRAIREFKAATRELSRNDDDDAARGGGVKEPDNTNSR